MVLEFNTFFNEMLSCTFDSSNGNWLIIACGWKGTCTHNWLLKHDIYESAFAFLVPVVVHLGIHMGDHKLRI